MNTTLFVLAAVVAVLYIAFSPDPFASAIRAKIPFWQRRAGDAVDSVDARVAAGKAAQHGTVSKGRHSLFELNILLAESEQEVNRFTKEVSEDQKALALARKNNDRPAFDALVSELNDDQEALAEGLSAHQQLLDELKELEVGVDEERRKERILEQKGRVMIGKDRVADMQIGVNLALSGLDDNGAEAHMAEAERILNKKLARAQASKAAASGLTPGERAEKKADQYLKIANSGASAVKADDLWNQLDPAGK